MRSFQPWMLLFLMLCAACTPVLSPAPVDPTLSSVESRPDWQDLSIFAAGLIPSQKEVLNQMDGATRYRIDYTIDV